MNQDLFNILSSSNKDIDNQKLMDYLSGKLSKEEQYEVEKWINETEFASDALDGLRELSGNPRLESYVRDLNKNLNTYIHQKKNRRERKRFRDTNWISISLVIILVLVVVGYLVVRRLISH